MDMVFCPSCGARLDAGEKEVGIDELSFIEPFQDQNVASGSETPYENSSWDDKPIKWFVIHGSFFYSGGREGGDLVLTSTGLKFTSKNMNLRLYYQSMVHVEQILKDQFTITTKDGIILKFRVINARTWVEKIIEMKEFA